MYTRRVGVLQTGAADVRQTIRCGILRFVVIAAREGAASMCKMITLKLVDRDIQLLHGHLKHCRGVAAGWTVGSASIAHQGTPATSVGFA